MMAERSGLKPRTFARRFQSATGYLPMDYVHTLRIEEAKQLIETDGGSIDDIRPQGRLRGPDLFPPVVQAQDRPYPGRLPAQIHGHAVGRKVKRSQFSAQAAVHSDQGSSIVMLGHRSCHRFAAMRAAYCASRTCPRGVGEWTSQTDPEPVGARISRRSCGLAARRCRSVFRANSAGRRRSNIGIIAIANMHARLIANAPGNAGSTSHRRR